MEIVPYFKQLGSQQKCPRCGGGNRPGLELPAECHWCGVKMCKITGNICGTDTWMAEHSCQCPQCQLYLADPDTQCGCSEYPEIVDTPRKIFGPRGE